MPRDKQFMSIFRACGAQGGGVCLENGKAVFQALSQKARYTSRDRHTRYSKGLRN
ncbi:hypothetical protein KSB_35060 [Ktedonobacter robiniae]|uniref:Uncharacterized protein n=1 Tax=Ktedonobacter robiniae TaxID=2778365 RepID=A0ABQ3UQK8_9CHLR|nr:hypothetical protein KSB_35060 [Ktedonobacter robiniae]